jgi:cbb3-type cytochrome oxidase cytochrome c subunit
MNPSSTSNLPTTDQLALQSESNTLTSLQDPSSVVPTSLLNSYSQLTSEPTSEWSYENQNSFSMSPSQSVLYTTNLYQQAYNQATSFLKNNSSLGQQLNITA